MDRKTAQEVLDGTIGGTRYVVTHQGNHVKKQPNKFDPLSCMCAYGSNQKQAPLLGLAAATMIYSMAFGAVALVAYPIGWVAWSVVAWWLPRI